MNNKKANNRYRQKLRCVCGGGDVRKPGDRILY